MAPVLHLHNTKVTRNGKHILSNINWTVEEDQRWIILGPNGAGKTTLLSIAAARLHPTSGQVDILDEILGAVDVFELRPRIGLSSAPVAQQTPANETVLNTVITAAYGVSGRWKEEYDSFDDNQGLALLADWGVDHLANRTFGSLSEGEKKRVLIARALMTDPELLILDEPAAGMDIAGREDLVQRLTTLATDPYAPATILVTHHLEEIPPGFTHAMLLKDGQILAAGPIDQTLTSQNLSATYDMPLELTQHPTGRYSAFAA